MLFKLSLKNIKKSAKDYAIYFFTLILGVAIFYVFNALDSQTVMLDVSKNTSEMIDLMNQILSGVSVFVSIILGALIIYASRFLIKRRNKEFGIYLTLGMSKRKMSMILFFETLLIGIISLAVGLGIGILVSQFMSVLVANMFDADMTSFTFTFSKGACIKTGIYFGIMYLLVMIFNTISISKCKLIDLLHGAKKSEKLKLKNPYLCTFIFIIASVVLGYAYYKVTSDLNSLDSPSAMLKIIAMGSISTFFIFWSLSGLLIKIFTSLKKTYYKGLNSFTLRQFSSKINTMVMSMTIICLMLFFTICLLSSAFSMSNSMNHNLRTLAPVDIVFDKNWNISGDLQQAIIEDSKYDIRTTFINNNFDISNLKDIVEVNYYKDNNLTFGSSLGDDFNEIVKQYAYLEYNKAEIIMKISDYNKVAKLYNLETYTLKNNEYMIISDFASMTNIRNKALKNNRTITINNVTYTPKYNECKNGFVEIESVHTNIGIFLVPDNAVNDEMLSHNLLIANYNADTKQEKQEIEKQVVSFFDKTWNTLSLTSYSSKISITENSVGLGAMVTFIGLYLGIIFLIASAAILALKEMSESADNVERFKILRKIGTDEKMINKALFIQIGIFFLFPLLIGIIHSIFGIKFAINVLEVFGSESLLESILMTSGIIVAVYGGYFLITYFSSKNIIKERF